MAIETFGLTAATLAPYLTQIEGQYGAVDDGLSDTDIDTIILDRAAILNVALVQALGPTGPAQVAAEDVAEGMARTILIDLVLPEIYRSLYSASVLPEFLRDQYQRGMNSVARVRKQPSALGLSVGRATIRLLDTEVQDDRAVNRIFNEDIPPRDRW